MPHTLSFVPFVSRLMPRAVRLMHGKDDGPLLGLMPCSPCLSPACLLLQQ